MMLEYVIPEGRPSVALYFILKQELKLSSRLIIFLKKNSGITVNRLPYRTIDPVKPGDIVKVSWEEETESWMEPENLTVDILYEDNWFLALNKPAGMAVHPSANHHSGTLANKVQYLFNKSGLSAKIRPVNRLDLDTSGITLFAKHSHAQDLVIRQMKRNEVYKEYIGIVEGIFSPTIGVIDLPIMRKPESVMERIIHPSGDRSITQYKTLRTYGEYSLVQFVLETGRTHQIRVHCRACGHPILGDWLYSETKTALINRQALHFHKLVFIHPESKKIIQIQASFPEDMRSAMKEIIRTDKHLDWCLPVPKQFS